MGEGLAQKRGQSTLAIAVDAAQGHKLKGTVPVNVQSRLAVSIRLRETEVSRLQLISGGEGEVEAPQGGDYTPWRLLAGFSAVFCPSGW